jgi:hypothetical protein
MGGFWLAGWRAAESVAGRASWCGFPQRGKLRHHLLISPSLASASCLCPNIGYLLRTRPEMSARARIPSGYSLWMGPGGGRLADMSINPPITHRRHQSVTKNSWPLCASGDPDMRGVPTRVLSDLTHQLEAGLAWLSVDPLPRVPALSSEVRAEAREKVRDSILGERCQRRAICHYKCQHRYRS